MATYQGNFNMPQLPQPQYGGYQPGGIKPQATPGQTPPYIGGGQTPPYIGGGGQPPINRYQPPPTGGQPPPPTGGVPVNPWADYGYYTGEPAGQTGGIKPPVGDTPPYDPNGGGGYTPYTPPPGGVPYGPTTTPPMGQDGGPPVGMVDPNLPQLPQAPQQQYGLSGGENAFTEGAIRGSNALQEGTLLGLGTLQGGFNQAQNSYGQGINALRGVGGATDQSAALGMLRNDNINQFANAGVQSGQLQAAMSGALGPEAQAQAMANFQSSPGQDFLRQQGEQSRVNQAAATGGVGGGELLKELTQYGTGIAAQDFQNQFNRLGSLSDRGMQAANTQAQMSGQGANILSNTNTSDANRDAQLAQAQANLFGQSAGMAGDLSRTGAGFQFAGGQGVSNLLNNAGQNVGNARLQAGRDIAGQLGQTTQSLADYTNQQGRGLSDLIGSGAGSLQDLLRQAGISAGGSQQDLARLLSQITTGQGNAGRDMAIAGGETTSAEMTARNEAYRDMMSNLNQGFGTYMNTP